MRLLGRGLAAAVLAASSLALPRVANADAPPPPDEPDAVGTAAHRGEPAAREPVAIPHAWSGHEEFTTETFEASGTWEVALEAWCHVGLSHVRAAVVDRHGVAVGDVIVWGQGARSWTLTTPAGTYSVVVTSPTMFHYMWELSVRPLASSAP